MEATDGLFALARCQMGLFVFLNLLTEKELRLACWETAAGRKAQNFSTSAKGSTKTKGFVVSRGSLMTYMLSGSAVGCQAGCGVDANGGTHLTENVCPQT